MKRPPRRSNKPCISCSHINFTRNMAKNVLFWKRGLAPTKPLKIRKIWRQKIGNSEILHFSTTIYYFYSNPLSIVFVTFILLQIWPKRCFSAQIIPRISKIYIFPFWHNHLIICLRTSPEPLFHIDFLQRYEIFLKFGLLRLRLKFRLQLGLRVAYWDGL